ncbi:hypothetical protein ACRYCC_26080 [Actinomadura scrupuli]|uniref:hypothetical protein n=1 Tax=Actinomadura scrupuli TaxID=559629 RepID=UPI003D98C31F
MMPDTYVRTPGASMFVDPHYDPAYDPHYLHYDPRDPAPAPARRQVWAQRTVAALSLVTKYAVVTTVATVIVQLRGVV